MKKRLLLFVCIFLTLSACAQSTNEQTPSRKPTEQIIPTVTEKFKTSSTPTSSPSPTYHPRITPTPTVKLTQTLAHPEIIYVPEDHSTIQEAIDAARDGDEIIVSPGTYTENIDFKGKDITLRSSDPEDLDIVAATIIDGGENGSVVTFQNGETGKAKIAGFTITNGTGSPTKIYGYDFIAGGGILISGGSTPTIENNIIHNNTAMHGSGIYIRKSSPTIQGNTIIDNLADYGGGILIFDVSSPKIEGNMITRNHAEEGGGGILAYDNAWPTIKDNTISENSSSLAKRAFHRVSAAPNLFTGQTRK